MEITVYVDTKPPYPEEIAGKPYPANYTPPIISKYDGITGNAREHIKQYVDALTTHSHNNELRLREFSKSLKGQAFTWYTSLAPGLVLSWNNMATQFMKKFFALEESSHCQICNTRSEGCLRDYWSIFTGLEISLCCVMIL